MPPILHSSRSPDPALIETKLARSTICDTFADTPAVFPASPDPWKSYQMCNNDGQVMIPFGSAEYVGLGMCVFLMLVFIEMFGSPFMKNCEVIECPACDLS